MSDPLAHEKKAKELPPPYHKRLTADEVRFLKLALHPTNRADAKEKTRQLLTYLNDRECSTSLEIQQTLTMAEMTALKRLKTLTQFKLLKREMNRYYRTTPRLQEFVRLYMKGM